MSTTRAISLNTHGVLEILGAPLLMAAPFVLHFGTTTAAVSVALGVMLLWLAVSTHSDQRTIPLSAHAGFDYVIAALAIVAGIVLGISNSEPVATAFLVGFGAAHMALTASTRFSTRGS